MIAFRLIRWIFYSIFSAFSSLIASASDRWRSTGKHPRTPPVPWSLAKMRPWDPPACAPAMWPVLRPSSPGCPPTPTSNTPCASTTWKCGRSSPARTNTPLQALRPILSTKSQSGPRISKPRLLSTKKVSSGCWKNSRLTQSSERSTKVRLRNVQKFRLTQTRPWWSHYVKRPIFVRKI